MCCCRLRFLGDLQGVIACKTLKDKTLPTARNLATKHGSGQLCPFVRFGLEMIIKMKMHAYLKMDAGNNNIYSRCNGTMNKIAFYIEILVLKHCFPFVRNSVCCLPTK